MLNNFLKLTSLLKRLSVTQEIVELKSTFYINLGIAYHWRKINIEIC